MKIARIITHQLKAPLGKARFYSSQAAFPERTSMIVEVIGDDGTSGWGEGGQWGPTEPVANVIDSILAPRLIGRNVHEANRIWEELYAYTRDFSRTGPYVEAISALDVALWDLKGKDLNVPVYTLLGGPFRTSVPAYATGCYYRGADVQNEKAVVEAVGREAASYVADGFSMLKIKIGLWPIEKDKLRIKAIREAVGDAPILMADANHAYRVSDAIRAGRILEQYGYRMFEEPVPPEDIEGYRRVRNSLDIAIAGGECEYTRWGFRSLIDNEAVDILQPDISVSGGISEFMKITALATSRNLLVMPHVWGSGIALAASLQALALVPETPYRAFPVPLETEPAIEYDRNPNPLRDDLCGGFDLADGRLEIPAGPGLGITVNRDVLTEYSSTR